MKIPSALWPAFLALTTATSQLLCMAQQLPPSQRASSAAETAAHAIERLQSWYDPATGLYRTTGWWNSANAITTLADFARATGSRKFDLIFRNTFVAAQKTSPGFLNSFYDDEGWWALAWIDVYDLSHQQKYMSMAESIFADMAKGWDDTCAGGIWWSKDRKYKNAIANELFLSVAAHLATRAKSGPQRQHYLQLAQQEWHWFSHSGMINSDQLINDGLDQQCANNHRTTWTYNQGVILGGLSELSRQSSDPAFLAQANSIAAATLSSPVLTDAQGILHDVCEPSCGADGTQFKGIFIRNLRLLDQVAPSTRFEEFVAANAVSISRGMQPPEYGIGVRWSPPYGPANASTQSSGADDLVAAIPMRTTSKQKP